MAAYRGRIEARIVVPTGGYAVSYTDSAGTGTATVAAGNYSGPTAFLAALVAAVQALAGAIGANFTGSISNGESGTGKTTMHSTDTPWSMTFTNTEVRDILGYTGNISSVSSAQVSTKSCRGLWMPDVVKWTPNGDDGGDDNIGVVVSDIRQLVSPSGHVWTFGGNERSELRGMRWEGISNNKAKIRYETVTNESFERFWRDSFLGDVAYIKRGAVWTVFWNADDTPSTEFVLVGMKECDPRTLVANWTGKYVVELGLLIKVPA